MDKVLHVDVNLYSNIRPLDFTISASSQGRLPNYTGSYVVEPRKVQQILPTANRSMIDDVIVNEIFYSEVSNPQGGNTVVIGQE